jgi:hypothetical protein
VLWFRPHCAPSRGCPNALRRAAWSPTPALPRAPLRYRLRSAAPRGRGSRTSRRAASRRSDSATSPRFLGHAQLSRHRGVRLPGGAPENQTRAQGCGLRRRRPASPLLQHPAFFSAQHQLRDGSTDSTHGYSPFHSENASGRPSVPRTSRPATRRHHVRRIHPMRRTRGGPGSVVAVAMTVPVLTKLVEAGRRCCAVQPMSRSRQVFGHPACPGQPPDQLGG